MNTISKIIARSSLIAMACAGISVSAFAEGDFSNSPPQKLPNGTNRYSLNGEAGSHVVVHKGKKGSKKKHKGKKHAGKHHKGHKAATPPPAETPAEAPPPPPPAQ